MSSRRACLGAQVSVPSKGPARRYVSPSTFSGPGSLSATGGPSPEGTELSVDSKKRENCFRWNRMSGLRPQDPIPSRPDQRERGERGPAEKRGFWGVSDTVRSPGGAPDPGPQRRSSGPLGEG